MHVESNGKSAAKERLRSWKEIAGFFGTDERTVKRWAATRGLPVQRVPGGTRTPIYADVAALQNWLAASHEGGAEKLALPAEPPPAAVPARRARSAPLAALAGAAVAAAIALALYLGPLRDGEASAHQPPQEAVELYLAGLLHWEKRSPESLARATRYFSQALARDPEYAAAYAGLANCYLLMREYTGMPDEQAYPMAEAAARRALSLDPGLSEAHAALAFATFYWARDFDRARQSFERAVALAPDSAHARHWYATALLHVGDMKGALEQINAAQRLAPQSASILADKGLVLFHAGRAREATAMLREVSALEPGFQSPHVYLSIIHMTGGEDAEFLRHAGHAARLRGDASRLALLGEAQRGFERGGRRGMLEAMLAVQARLHAEGRESAYAVAATQALLGDRPQALRYLRKSVEAREPLAVGLRIEPAFRGLRGDAGYRALAGRMGNPAAESRRAVAG
jgi:tetratricopeptide (TPR) repeat protein